MFSFQSAQQFCLSFCADMFLMCFPSLRIYFDKSVHTGTEGAEELALGEFV